MTVPPFFRLAALASEGGPPVLVYRRRYFMAQEQSRAQQLVGDIAPKLAELTDEVLFGDVWARPSLSPRDRSLNTVAALTALGRTDQLRSHLGLALDNAVTREELAEASWFQWSRGSPARPVPQFRLRGCRARRPPA
jgi:4-carboxymuconolactone decarboxylase